MTAAAGVLNLSEQPAVLGLDGIGPALERIQIIVVPGPRAVCDVLVPRHADRLGYDERCATARAVGVILDELLGHAGVRRHVRIHRRVHDAVAQAFAGERKRREK